MEHRRQNLKMEVLNMFFAKDKMFASVVKFVVRIVILLLFLVFAKLMFSSIAQLRDTPVVVHELLFWVGGSIWGVLITQSLMQIKRKSWWRG